MQQLVLRADWKRVGREKRGVTHLWISCYSPFEAFADSGSVFSPRGETPDTSYADIKYLLNLVI
jgi:hypothetical protein